MTVKYRSHCVATFEDLIELGILSQKPTGDRANKNTINELELNKIISRREYARWLLTANNRIYAHNPSKQIRLASNSAAPAFQDVLPSNPDFPIIQGLAEAGILPSRLTRQFDSCLVSSGSTADARTADSLESSSRYSSRVTCCHH